MCGRPPARARVPSLRLLSKYSAPGRALPPAIYRDTTESAPCESTWPVEIGGVGSRRLAVGAGLFRG